MVHDNIGGIGFFNERIDYYRGFWSMRCLDDLYLGPSASSPMFGFGNIQTVGPSSGYPIGAGGIISIAKFVGWGSRPQGGNERRIRAHAVADDERTGPARALEHGRPRSERHRRVRLSGGADHLQPPRQRLHGGGPCGTQADGDS